MIGLLILTAAVAAQRSRGNTRNRDEARTPDETSSAVQWEYLVVSGGNVNLSTSGNESYGSMRKIPDSSFTREAFPLERNLDKLGAKGWELVSVTGNPNDPVFYLKRHIAPTQ
jgi:hypothetical protein